MKHIDSVISCTPIMTTCGVFKLSAECEMLTSLTCYMLNDFKICQTINETTSYSGNMTTTNKQKKKDYYSKLKTFA